MDTEQSLQTRRYSSKWQQRFDVFERLQSLDAAGKKAFMKSLGWRKAGSTNFNFIAFFFGFIYFFVLGMWRRNLSMIGIIVLINALVIAAETLFNIEIPDALARGMGCAFSAWYATTANIAYYLQEIKGYNGWNPFKVQP